MILSELAPFALPYLTAVYMLKREKTGFAALALALGAFFGYHDQFIFVVSAMIAYVLIQKFVATFVRNKTAALPYVVFSASLLTRLSIEFVTLKTVTNYALMMAIVEAGLSFILTMIFLQSVPLVTSKRLQHPLRNEEIVCMIILLASVMTGTVGWIVFNLTIEHILARYLILLFAFVGGAAIGSTVGVVTGLILSLASVANLFQMSLLAFSGLLGGLLKEGKKIGVSIGLLVGTLLIGLYGDGSGHIVHTLIESLVAIGLFFLTPKSSLERLAAYIPGTVEYSKEQQQYLRKIRDATANRVNQFSALFQTLSQSFRTPILLENKEEENDVDYFLSKVTEKTCQACFKKERCWVKNFNKTYENMQAIMTEMEENREVKNRCLLAEWKRHCVKHGKVVQTIKDEYERLEMKRRLKRQVLESRQLVADQLLGVSKVMGTFAKEIQKEKEASFFYQEEQILEALRGVGLEVGHVEIYRLDQGNIEIEMSVLNEHGQCEKVIAPILSDLLKETIIVQREEPNFYENGYSHVTFRSANKFVVETGAAHVAQGGAWVSGDCYSMIELDSGKYALAISDGMGNGERAHVESNETLELLRNVLQSGIEETVAIKSVNSILSLRSTEEMFSTVDLAMIDLQDATTKFLKVGSIPSFIKRGREIIKIEANNLPMGMFQEFDVDVVCEQLKAGDLLIMMSDGIYDAPKHVENKELWMKRILREIQTDDPQEMADVILERVIRAADGAIEDDMTVVVAKIKRNIPKWTAIPLYKTPKLFTRKERKKA